MFGWPGTITPIGNPLTVADARQREPLSFNYSATKTSIVKNKLIFKLAGIGNGEVKVTLIGVNKDGKDLAITPETELTYGRKYFANDGENTFSYHNWMNFTMVKQYTEDQTDPLYALILKDVLPKLTIQADQPKKTNPVTEILYGPEESQNTSGRDRGTGVTQFDYRNAPMDVSNYYGPPVIRKESFFANQFNNIAVGCVCFIVGVILYKYNKPADPDVEEYFKRQRQENDLKVKIAKNKIKQIKAQNSMKEAENEIKDLESKNENLGQVKEAIVKRKEKIVKRDDNFRKMKSKELMKDLEEKQILDSIAEKSTGSGQINFGNVSFGQGIIGAGGELGKQAIKTGGEVVNTTLKSGANIAQSALDNTGAIITGGAKNVTNLVESGAQNISNAIKQDKELQDRANARTSQEKIVSTKESGATERIGMKGKTDIEKLEKTQDFTNEQARIREIEAYNREHPGEERSLFVRRGGKDTAYIPPTGQSVDPEKETEENVNPPGLLSEEAQTELKTGKIPLGLTNPRKYSSKEEIAEKEGTKVQQNVKPEESGIISGPKLQQNVKPEESGIISGPKDPIVLPETEIERQRRIIDEQRAIEANIKQKQLEKDKLETEKMKKEKETAENLKADASAKNKIIFDDIELLSTGKDISRNMYEQIADTISSKKMPYNDTLRQKLYKWGQREDLTDREEKSFDKFINFDNEMLKREEKVFIEKGLSEHEKREPEKMLEISPQISQMEIEAKEEEEERKKLAEEQKRFEARMLAENKPKIILESDPSEQKVGVQIAKTAEGKDVMITGPIVEKAPPKPFSGPIKTEITGPGQPTGVPEETKTRDIQEQERRKAVIEAEKKAKLAQESEQKAKEAEQKAKESLAERDRREEKERNERQGQVIKEMTEKKLKKAEEDEKKEREFYNEMLTDIAHGNFKNRGEGKRSPHMQNNFGTDEDSVRIAELINVMIYKGGLTENKRQAAQKLNDELNKPGMVDHLIKSAIIRGVNLSDKFRLTIPKLKEKLNKYFTKQ